MIWLSFERWALSAGSLFIRKRVYWRGYKWTPFVKISLREHDIYKIPDFEWKGTFYVNIPYKGGILRNKDGRIGGRIYGFEEALKEGEYIAEIKLWRR